MRKKLFLIKRIFFLIVFISTIATIKFEIQAAAQVKNIENIQNKSEITVSDTIVINDDSEISEIPKSFCIIPDNLYLIADYKNQKIIILETKNKQLNYLTSVNNSNFQQPAYLKYFVQGNKQYLAVVDFGTRKIYFFSRYEKIKFKLEESIDCPRLCYDLAMRKADELIISGYTTDKWNNTYGLFTLNIKNQKMITPILPSFKKYTLNDNKEYVQEYQVKQALPAIGLKSFIDISGNDLYFVWEGALNIIKVNLSTLKISPLEFKYNKTFYKKPDSQILIRSYFHGDVETTRRIKDTMSYIKNLFVTSNRVFLIYQTKPDNETEPVVRLQSYTTEGAFICDSILLEKPKGPMWFDKKKMELHFFSKKVDTGKFVIFSYKLPKE